MPKKIALLIGVTENKDYNFLHSAAANNMAAMQRVLQDPNLGAFERVESLINPNLETMQNAIQSVFAGCGINDLALLYFSGHCILNEEGHLYFTTSITTQDNLLATSLPASFMKQQLSLSNAERQIVILESCYNQSFTEGLSDKSVAININKELADKGRTILTSSTAIQTSLEEEKINLSLYTQYLVEGIETGAADRDGAGLIYVRELHNYAQEKVQNVNPKIQPYLIGDEKEFDVVLTVLLNQDPNNGLEEEYHKIEAKYRKIVENYGRNNENLHLVNYTLNKKEKTFGITVDQDTPDDLSSEMGIDYTKLRDLLKAGKWKEADQETLTLMLRAVNREYQDYLNIESVENFPCTDLYTIDNLWSKYSLGQFGFSLQKEIWLKVGGEIGHDDTEIQENFQGSTLGISHSLEPMYELSHSNYKNAILTKVQHDNVFYEQFGLRVGWRDRNGVKLLREWTKYDNLCFSLTWAPVGHLPTLASSKKIGFDELNFWRVRSSLFSRMNACWL
jgi:hypothetical protein